MPLFVSRFIPFNEKLNMQQYLRFLFAVTIGLMLLHPASAQENTLDKTKELIAKASKADDLYSVRIMLKRSSGKKDLSTAELESLAESYRLLSGGFARFNHYKNAVESYTSYLLISEQLISTNRQFQTDSIKSQHARIEQEELSEISRLDKGKNALIDKRNSLSGGNDSYFMWGGLATAALLIFFIITLIRINRKTNEARLALTQMESVILGLFRESIAARLNNGIPNYIGYYSTRATEALKALVSQPTEGDAKSPIGTEEFRKSLLESLNKISSVQGAVNSES